MSNKSEVAVCEVAVWRVGEVRGPDHGPVNRRRLAPAWARHEIDLTDSPGRPRPRLEGEEMVWGLGLERRRGRGVGITPKMVVNSPPAGPIVQLITHEREALTKSNQRTPGERCFSVDFFEMPV